MISRNVVIENTNKVVEMFINRLEEILVRIEGTGQMNNVPKPIPPKSSESDPFPIASC
jgi:hypothetical protein